MGVPTSSEEIFSDVFILDDLTPLGVNLPNDLFNCFNRDRSLCVLDAGDLARGMCSAVVDFEDPVVLSGGGVLTYTLMKREGYDEVPEIVDIRRDYVLGEGSRRPEIVFSFEGNYDGRNCIDDIVSSGATINQLGSDLRVASLMLSCQARGVYRTKNGSTIKGIETLFTSGRVNCKSGFPAIFSARYLVKKIRDNPSYVNYVAKYADASKLLSVVNEIDKSPFDLLYDDPIQFIERYGR